MNLLSIKILNIIVIFCAGFFGPTIVLFFKKYQKDFELNDTTFLLLKLFSAGIILGTGCIHMLPEAKDLFDEANITQYPYSELIFGISIISIMALEEVINKYFHRSKNDNHTDTNNLNYNNINNIELGNTHKSGEHCHTVNIIYQQDPNLKKLITLYILEFGMAIHSIIIGITIGTSTSKDILIVLAIAINCHQFFEGIALGSAIIQCDNSLTYAKTFLIILCYSITTPVGIAIGIKISDQNSFLLQGILNAISAGILVYMATIHFIIEDYINNEATELKKFFMFLALGLGYGLMSIIGIWS